MTVSDVTGMQRSTDVTENEHYRLFAEERRRTTYDVLRSESEPVALEDMAKTVAHREGRGTDEESVERVAITLHHVHLPMMDDVGVIDYDPDECLVVTAEHA